MRGRATRSHDEPIRSASRRTRLRPSAASVPGMLAEAPSLRVARLAPSRHKGRSNRQACRADEGIAPGPAELFGLSDRPCTLCRMSELNKPTELAVSPPATASAADVPVELPKDGAFWPSLLVFLSTTAGKEIRENIALWVGSLRDLHKAKHTIDLVSTISRYLLMAGIIGSAVGLQAYGHLDSAVTGLLGLALGYLFGRQKSQD